MRHIFLPLLALVGVAAAGPTPAGSAPAPERGPVPMSVPPIAFDLASDSVTVPMRIVDGRIHVDVVFDGRGPFPFIFDTGAQGSVMDLAFAGDQGLPLGPEVMVGSPGGGGLPGRIVVVPKLAIGGLTLMGLTSVAFEGLPFSRGDASPRGVLGPYDLRGLLVTLDYPAQRLLFRHGALPEPDRREVFGWDRARGLPEIPAKAAGENVLVHLDSGSSATVDLPTAFADRLPLAGPLVDMGFAKTVDAVKPLRGARLRGAFTLGRYMVEAPTIRFVDMAPGVGNMGSAILGAFALTIDPANARLRLAGPADGRIQVREERKPRYGLQFEALEASPLRVLVVDAGSPAERGGLRADDRIVSINGKAVGALGVTERVEALQRSPLRLIVARADSTLPVAMTLD